jgi:hypothetical protein
VGGVKVISRSDDVLNGVIQRATVPTHLVEIPTAVATPALQVENHTVVAKASSPVPLWERRASKLT